MRPGYRIPAPAAERDLRGANPVIRVKRVIG